MYKLTLTGKDRDAIDKLGDVASPLFEVLVINQLAPDDSDWDDTRDITFALSEGSARMVAYLCDDRLLARLPQTLRNVLTIFRGRIKGGSR